MSKQIARHSVARYYTAEIRRGVQVLPDGKYAVMTFDSNRSGSSYGDKSNIAKAVVRLLDNDGTQLGSATFPLYAKAGLDVTSLQGGMCVDSAGNLHVVYTYHGEPQNSDPTKQDQKVRYVKITRSSNSLSVGTHELIHQTNGDEAIASVDIDIPGTTGSYPVIVNAFTNWATNKSHVKIYHRQTSGSWWSDYIHEMLGLYHFPTVAIGCRTDTGGSAFSFVVTYTTVPIAADQGDFIITGRFNLGGTRIGINPYWKQGLNKHQNDGWREFSVFHVAGDLFLVVGTTGMNPFRPFISALRIDQATGELTTVIEPYARSDAGGSYVKYSNIPFSSWNIIRENANTGKLVAFHFDNEFVYANLFDYTYSGGNLSVTPSLHRITLNKDISKFNSVNPLSVIAGDHGRHSTGATLACGITYGEPSWRYVFSSLDTPPTSRNISPADNSQTASSHPVLVARPQGSGTGNSIGRVEFELALDTNFASGLVDGIYSNYIWINGTNNAEGYVLTDSLVQGRYYLRSRVRDILGTTGNWSPTTSFFVSHKPSARNLSPTGGGFAGYAPGEGVTLSWTFQDPDPQDVQTAYRVILTESTTGTVIHDTGKILSGDSQVTVPVSESHAEKILVWSLILWDRDDVSSDNIPGSRFYLAKAPLVSLLSPASSTVSDANLNISWSNTVYGGRAQQAYRVWIYRVVDRKTVFDTGFKSGTANSVLVPPGILRNNTDYVLQVTVQDTNSLQGRAFYAFHTEWPLPLLLDPPVVDTDVYQQKGYAYVTAKVPDVSSYVNKDFITGYTLFRRTYESGGDEWVEIYTGLPSGSPFMAMKDYTLPSGIPSEYAFVMVLDIYGEVQVGNPEQSEVTVVTPINGQYWLIDLDDPDQSLMLPHVTDDGWSDDYELEEYNIINRGRVVEIGDRIGNTGSLTSKLRDAGNGLPGVPVFNSTKNARLVTDTVGASLPSWNVVPTGSTSVELAEVNSFAAAPTGRDGALEIKLTQGSGNPGVSLNQDIFRIKPEATHHATVWLDASRTPPGGYLDLKVVFYNTQNDSGVLTTYQERWTVDSNWQGDTVVYNLGTQVVPEFIAQDFSYSWYKLNLQVTVPEGAVKAKVTITLDSSTSQNTIYFNLGGVAFTDHESRFFDGYSIDAEWVGEPEKDPSYTPGSYTARKMRQNIEAMKRRKGDVVLRTPFGDTYRVQVGNISFARIPGVGSNEFVDVTIPYLEISDD